MIGASSLDKSKAVELAWKQLSCFVFVMMAFGRFWPTAASLMVFFFGGICNEKVEFLQFTHCKAPGWTCVQDEASVNVVYQCSKSRKGRILIGEVDINLPKLTDSLTVKNCQSVQMSFAFNFTNNKSNSTAFALKNILSVEIFPSLRDVIYPKNILFQNIHSIKSIQSYTFTKIWRSIVFHNVTIEHVASDGFIHLNVKVMNWENVTVSVLDTNALNDVSATEFTISDSHIGIFELLSFQVRGEKVIVRNCKIGDVRFNAVVVLADTFILFNNTGFDVVMPNALNILARKVLINNNNFTYLQTEALERIGPTLLEEDPGAQIVYSFQNNHIEVADIASLHVSLLDYLQIGADIQVGNNTFSCSCTHLGWLGLAATEDNYFRELHQFHEMLLAQEQNNTCGGAPCHLPISILRQLVKVQSACAANLTGAQLCAMFSPMTTYQPTVASTTTPVITTTITMTKSKIFTASKITSTTASLRESPLPVLSISTKLELCTSSLVLWCVFFIQ